jgi:N-acetyl sugar amidotransferase
MDTSDSNIKFDDKGVCDHCLDFKLNVKPRWHTDERGRAELESTAQRMREFGKGKEFDCILGMSGGLDSSYMLHLVVKELKLRPLVFHVDGGWNAEAAVHNIEVMIEKLGLDLYTEVINWEEMKDFQLSFFKASVPHIDIPQDHAFIGTLYNFAYKNNIKFILNGYNLSTEAVNNPLEWMYYGTDMAQLRDIHGRFGKRELKTFPFSSVFRHKFYLRYIRKIEVVKPLNNLPYSKELAIRTLTEEYGWVPYPQKHFESRFTKFYEGYWLPTKFGYDTRRCQFSSLIMTDQMTREDALEQMKKPAYDPATIQNEIDFIASKLEISSEELMSYHALPNKTFRDYKNQYWMFEIGARVLKALGIERVIKR